MTIETQLQQCIDQKTKPRGALGLLESLALQIGSIQRTLTPSLKQPTLIIFAGDHGIADEGVSCYPQAVTWQMVHNFLAGGAAINVFARQHGLQLKVVDAGVNHHFDSHPNLIDAKIALGTHNFLLKPAMSESQCRIALERGSHIVQQTQAQGCNVIGFGEMGIGNTASAALLMHGFTGFPLITCVGRGTGLDFSGLAHKRMILARALATHSMPSHPLSILSTFGGFEIAMMVGAFCQAARASMLIMVDGFIASVAALIASRLEPSVLSHCVFMHQSQEAGHIQLLNFLNVRALLALEMRLGEGTGIAVGYPILQSAVAFLTEMASFEEAQVSHQLLKDDC